MDVPDFGSSKFLLFAFFSSFFFAFFWSTLSFFLRSLNASVRLRLSSMVSASWAPTSRTEDIIAFRVAASSTYWSSPINASGGPPPISSLNASVPPQIPVKFSILITPLLHSSVSRIALLISAMFVKFFCMVTLIRVTESTLSCLDKTPKGSTPSWAATSRKAPPTKSPCRKRSTPAKGSSVSSLRPSTTPARRAASA